MPKRYDKWFDVLGVNVSAVNIDTAMQFIDGCIKNEDKVYICLAPVSTIVDCCDDKEYKKVIGNAAMVTPDGMPLVWLGRQSCGKTVSRTYGPDLLRAVCDFGQAKGYRHFFYGSDKMTLRSLVYNLESFFPAMKFVGSYAPSFIDKNFVESPDVIDKINYSYCDILWVGLGSPKQDFWMYNHRNKLTASVIIGVGAAFDFVSGSKKQAPVFVQKTGMEWFFRLCSEPRRLWRRYLIGNLRFVFMLIKESLRKIVRK